MLLPGNYLLNIWSATGFRKILSAVLNMKENMSNFVVSTVPADAIAPLNAATSAGTGIIIWVLYTALMFEEGSLL